MMSFKGFLKVLKKKMKSDEFEFGCVWTISYIITVLISFNFRPPHINWAVILFLVGPAGGMAGTLIFASVHDISKALFSWLQKFMEEVRKESSPLKHINEHKVQGRLPKEDILKSIEDEHKLIRKEINNVHIS